MYGERPKWKIVQKSRTYRDVIGRYPPNASLSVKFGAIGGRVSTTLARADRSNRNGFVVRIRPTDTEPTVVPERIARTCFSFDPLEPSNSIYYPIYAFSERFGRRSFRSRAHRAPYVRARITTIA